MKHRIVLSMMWIALLAFASCGGGEKAASSEATAAAETGTTDLGQAGVQDDESQKDIVKVAVGSADHSTLVKALQQAEYVHALANAGPFTVFAPTNAAFEKLPAGTLDKLMQAEQKDALRNILEYHVALAVYKENMIRDGQSLGMANGDNITLQVKDGKMMVNNSANVVAAVPASNGLVYVIDAVLLPPAK
ncbi:MAG: fasciclin domain-containing protein [Saprospiraceae bacterium]|nr:fasciclin domain-containing protein [Saprospiraceae bacterium]